jgi:hypothetical protein
MPLRALLSEQEAKDGEVGALSLHRRFFRRRWGDAACESIVACDETCHAAIQTRNRLARWVLMQDKEI